MVSERKSKDWINNCTNALEDASSKLSSSGLDNRFSLFDSSPYCAKKVTEADTSEDTKWNIRNWMKNSHLIFKDYSNGLETIDEVCTSFLSSLKEMVVNLASKRRCHVNLVMPIRGWVLISKPLSCVPFKGIQAGVNLYTTHICDCAKRAEFHSTSNGIVDILEVLRSSSLIKIDSSLGC